MDTTDGSRTGGVRQAPLTRSEPPPVRESRSPTGGDPSMDATTPLGCGVPTSDYPAATGSAGTAPYPRPPHHGPEPHIPAPLRPRQVRTPAGALLPARQAVADGQPRAVPPVRPRRLLRARSGPGNAPPGATGFGR